MSMPARGSSRRLAMWSGTIVVVLAVVAAGLHGCGDDDHHQITEICCPICGDGICSGDENDCNCGMDCHGGGICTQLLSQCGDDVCEPTLSPAESSERCPQDCPFECPRCPRSRRRVYLGIRRIVADACPTGATEAYREDDRIVCHRCAIDTDCLSPGDRCQMVCGPGCENDSGGCCGVRECLSPPS